MVGVLVHQHPIFFIKGWIASCEVKVEYCPTKEMVADFFTKPLQGSQFTKLHDHIMNINSAWQDYTSEDCRKVRQNEWNRDRSKNARRPKAKTFPARNRLARN